MPQELEWRTIKQQGTTPTPRSGHTITTVGKIHVMFGGLDNFNKKDGKLYPLNQVYTIRMLPKDCCEWKLQQCQGDIPLERSRHAACAIQQDKLFIFGGYYTSTLRFNDVYILKIGEFKWAQPPNQKSGGEPKNSESKIGAPSPRANCSANYHKGKVYIFGGHGGAGYQRQSFQDLYSFDTETSEWNELVAVAGNPPLPRGGHQAAIVEEYDKLIIYGGWSNCSQFSDVQIYDINSNEWQDPEITNQDPRWYHSAMMVKAIPSNKFFIFGGSYGNFEEGGNRTGSKISNDIYVLDMNISNFTTMKWSPINFENSFKPEARESCAMFFDSTDSRLVIFGGWSNKWCSDVQALNVSLITGPPYAIYSITPSLGPLTGKSKVTIIGDGFKDTGNIVVRFDSGKPNPPEVQGIFVSEKELHAETPSFEGIGAKEAEVTLSINKGDYTITKSIFRFYLNTKASLTIAFGPGVLHQNLIGVQTVFMIQARNTAGQNRYSGSDIFIVKITKPYYLKEGEVYADEYQEEEQEAAPISPTKQGQQQQQQEQEEQQEEDDRPKIIKKERFEEIPFKITDLENGQYIVAYQQDEEIQNISIEVFYQDQNNQLEPIRGNPFSASFVKDVPAKNNELIGPQVNHFISEKILEVEDFLTEKKKNINTKEQNINDNIKTLLKVKENLMDIEKQQDSILLNMDVIDQYLKYVEQESQIKSSDVSKVNKIKEEWKGLESMSQKIEKEIQQPMKMESEKTKGKIEAFDEHLKNFFIEMKRNKFYSDETEISDAKVLIEEQKELVEKKLKKLEKYVYYAKMFAYPDKVTNCQKQLDQIKQELVSVQQLWDHIEVCKERFLEYLQKEFLSVDVSELEDDLKNLKKQLQDLKGVDRKCRAYLGITKNIRDWQTFLPLLGELKEPSMNVPDNRHWRAVQKLVKTEFEVDQNLKLQLIWDLKLFDFKDGIEEITDQAKQELKMEKNIQKIVDAWQTIEFELIKHKNTDIYTLKLLDDNFDLLEEHQLQVNNMLLSKYIGYFEKIVEKWKIDLGSIYEVVGLLVDVQKSWSFLENLFIHSEEVKKELPNESEQFVDIDKETKQLMTQGGEIKNVLKFCSQDGMQKKLEQIQIQLKRCEKALNEFLDGKRRAFPRFYFVSVNDLLDILSNGNTPHKINRHMPKIFQAIDTLVLIDNNPGERPSAEKMNATIGGEIIDFVQRLQLVGKVEIYLEDLVQLMQKTLRDIAQRSLKSYTQMNRKQWLEKDPAQITILIDNIMYCRGVEETFQKIQQSGALSSMKDLFDKSVAELSELIKMVQGELTKKDRQKIMCLITLDTHGRDVIDRLHKENVRKADEFQWQSQLKFYWDAEKDDARIRIADASFDYYYEYLGNGPRLVVTPLTDRIYVTATQALHLKMGCAPAGPAGTGKTETTKDLSNALAKAIYVFNCSSEMNYESMGNIFKGLASSGCWGCFDEFNRLVPEVLSVCSVQFKAVTDAIKYKKQRFVIEGDEISLNPTCGVFITMNPGYLGRSELPEGLKALFRPITVVVPDLELICENMLMAEGFLLAKTLAKKFVTLYFLCKDLLSKSLHYDWGLRAIKSVLVVAGTFKRAELEVSEDSLLYRALRDFNMPKIIAADLPIFFGLLGDLFPRIEIERKRDMAFEKIIVQTCEQSKLYPHDQFVLKCVQLKELLEIRHCVFIMGPPGSGKSKTWQTLAKSFDNAGIKQLYVDLNPKVVSTKDFYGYNLPSKEWKDGLMSKLMRNYAEMADSNPKWILLDGDLDANWIESMNSVMDDNKILTLANNERIPLKAHMRLIFEIRDLRFASPATVSRAGILYISDDDGYQWKSYIKSWIFQQFPTNTGSPEQIKKNDEDGQNFQKLFDKYIEETIKYMRRSCKFTVPVSQISMVISLCKCLQKLLEIEVSNVEYLFIFALIWAFGGCLTEKDGIEYRKEFSTWWKGLKTSVKFPPKGTVFDYFVEVTDQTPKLEEWTKKVQNIDFNTQKGMNMSLVTVPTRETVATSTFMRYFIEVHHPVLLIGNAGCGKTQLCKGTLTQVVTQQPDQFQYQIITFNYYTDSEYLQKMLEQDLEKKGGRQFGPKGKAKLIYYIDDLNMPQLDPYDTQTAIALLRQHADYQHWYDVTKLSLKDIVNTQHLATMNPSAGSFFVNPRYQRHFWTCSVPFPDQESLNTIYNTFLGGHLKNFKPQIAEWGSPIIKAALLLHQQIQQTFRKTAINFHYEFNLRHISNVFAGILVSRSEEFKAEPDKMIRLWMHESERTYCDRLVSQDDIFKYKSMMFELVKKNFAKFTFTKYFQKDNPDSLLFCNFVTSLVDNRFYDQCPSIKQLETMVNEGLREYNDNNAYMGLVLFEDALKHVLKICRIISQPSGHALLVGVGGSGKQSLSKLAGSIMQYVNYSITISATYSMADLRTDLQMLYTKTGIKDEGYMFLFTEGQITNDRFLVYINDLLSSGEIAELYTGEEKEVIVNQLRNKVKQEGKPDTFQNCWDFFIEKVKKNLHMVLCFSPGDDLRRRARQFPAIVNCTVIDWYQPWPQDALNSVAEDFLKEQELGEEDVHKKIVQFMPFSFNIVNELSVKVLEIERRYIYTTPKSFLELINLYKNMLKKKSEEMKNNKERYETGLLRLEATQNEVAIIEEEVKVKQIEAEEKRIEADKFAETVGKEKAKVEEENKKAKLEQDKCELIKTNVEQQKTSTQADLDAAGPLVEEAKAALGGLKKNDFSQAKSFANPPPGVPDPFYACMYLLAGFYDQIEVDKNKKPKKVDWNSAKKLMANPDEFLNKLLNFKDTVDQNLVIPANVQQVKQLYLINPDFNGPIMIKKSTAAAGICEWVINIVKYWDVIQMVEPKRQALKEATEQLEDATVKLNIIMEKVNALNAELAKLEEQYNTAVAKKEAAMAEAARCERRLNLAQRLVSALGSEKDRWGNSVTQITEDMKVLVGDVLMASAFISYAGPFSKHFREEMVNKKFSKFIIEGHIPMTQNINPVKMLTDEARIAQWNQQGLPTDVVSIENGTILTNSDRYPLMIDPQLQGSTWIREKEKNNSLRCTRMGSTQILRDLEVSIENGFSVLIENMGERVDAIIMPIVARAFIKRGRNQIVNFAGKQLTLSPDFKLFLHTKLSNPHYPPEIQAEAACINFTVTEEGLGDQLLALVVKKERPDLSKKKLKLIQQQNDFKIKLAQLEKDLLQQLASAQGDILENIQLIENLEDSKKISKEIQEKVEIAQKTEIKINESSEAYRDVASRGALFYFLLTDLAKIHSFYKYSLESFIIVIERAIDKITEKKQEEEKPQQAGKAEDKQSEKASTVKDEGKKEENKEEGEKKEEGQKTEEGDKKAEGEGAEDGQKEEKKEEASVEQQQQQQQQQEEEGEDSKEKSKKQQKEEEDDDIIEDPLDPKALHQRVLNLIESITDTAFSFTRRGLFERDKLIVTAMLCFRIMIRSQKLINEEVNHLILGKIDTQAYGMPEVLKNFISDNMWGACKALEQHIPTFANFCQSLEQDQLQWKKWYNEEKAESADLPKAFKDLSKFHRLLLLRAMRPDRLSSALRLYIQEEMGVLYVEQPPFNIVETYKETAPQTPVFFVLFPGVDPTPEVERIGMQQGISIQNGKFINISMGQGQENKARDALFKAAKEGTWIMLQNLHLMQTWMVGLKGLEGFLEQVYATAHPNFRCFLSSEPPPMPSMQIIPESILQACLKVANEAPTDIKSNLRRAYAHFDQQTIDACQKNQNEFKAILFGLCFFHAIMLGRKKFGSQGWSRNYNFNDGDLTICADVLRNYLEKYDQVPYEDLRYIYGEIMYGGHITDNWDRRTNSTYLLTYIVPGILNNLNLAPGFKSPDPAKFNYQAYYDYIDLKLPIESPQMFGFHPNAEIGYLTQQCDFIMGTILDVNMGGSSGSGKKSSDVMEKLMAFKERCPPQYNIDDISSKINPKTITPFQVVCKQECERMNSLLLEIETSLEDLRLGLTGALNVTEAMEKLEKCLQINKVPETWEKIAYFSRKPLALWFNDLIERCTQLVKWSDDLNTPLCLCISYLFNPMSYLTAVMQHTARQKGLPLDNMALQTNVSQLKTAEEVQQLPETGVYIHGLYLEGAGWELGGQGQNGYLVDQKMKELHPKMPVINVISVTNEQKAALKGQYECPVYVTTTRGPTYVFTANLQMESEDSDPNKWILAGVCLVMADD